MDLSLSSVGNVPLHYPLPPPPPSPPTPEIHGMSVTFPDHWRTFIFLTQPPDSHFSDISAFTFSDTHLDLCALVLITLMRFHFPEIHNVKSASGERSKSSRWFFFCTLLLGRRIYTELAAAAADVGWTCRLRRLRIVCPWRRLQLHTASQT